MTETVIQYSDIPELADESFAYEVKAFMRELYARARNKLKETEAALELSRKSGAHIGKLIKRKRAIQAVMAELEVHGKRDVFLTEEDEYMMFKHYTRQSFIQHYYLYVTRHE